MDRVVNLSQTVAQVVAEYKTFSPMAVMHYVHDDQRGVDLVLVIPHDPLFEAHIVIMTRRENEHIIVEIDTTDRPLEEALIDAGIPRSQIIRAYAGKTAPEP